MGDRANVVLTTKENEGGDLVLYTHWNGSDVEQIVADGLRNATAADRLSDGSYAQRIIVETFFAAHTDKALGAGIYVGSPCEDHVVLVDLDTLSVTFDPEGYEYGPQNGTVTEDIEAYVERFASSKPLAV